MDYEQIKRHFNALMLEIEPVLEKRVEASADPLKSAVQYAMMGNFIDFAALDKVEESKLMELIDRAPDITVDEDTLEQLRDRAAKARTLALITDNCGEIVMDKILLRQFLRMNLGPYHRQLRRNCNGQNIAPPVSPHEPGSVDHRDRKRRAGRQRRDTGGRGAGRPH